MDWCPKELTEAQQDMDMAQAGRSGGVNALIRVQALAAIAQAEALVLIANDVAEMRRIMGESPR